MIEFKRASYFRGASVCLGLSYEYLASWGEAAGNTKELGIFLHRDGCHIDVLVEERLIFVVNIYFKTALADINEVIASAHVVRVLESCIGKY